MSDAKPERFINCSLRTKLVVDVYSHIVSCYVVVGKELVTFNQ
jgi:hypothetical protein